MCNMPCMSETANHRVPEWTLGDRLGKALSKAGIGKAEMAEYLGVSRNTIGNYIADRVQVPKATIIAWAMRTDVPLAWLETGVAPSTPQPPPTGVDGDELARLTERKRARGRAPARRVGLPPEYFRVLADVA